MAHTSLVSYQLGKKGLTENFVSSLEKTFKNHDLIKISILRSCSRNREEVRKMADEICSQLTSKFNKTFTYRLIGYTITMRKWRKLK